MLKMMFHRCDRLLEKTDDDSKHVVETRIENLLAGLKRMEVKAESHRRRVSEEVFHTANNRQVNLDIDTCSHGKYMTSVMDNKQGRVFTV